MQEKKLVLKEKTLSEDENFQEILIKNDNGNYIFFKKKHNWHNLKISKLMKEDISPFLKKETKEFFLDLQKIAKRQIETKNYLEKLQTEDNAVFEKMFKSKYYKQHLESITKSKRLITEYLHQDIEDFFITIDGIEYISDIYVSFLVDNKWFEAIVFYLLCSLKINSKINLDVEISIPSDRNRKQIDVIMITDKFCIIVECKSGENFDESEISKIKVYKDSISADIGLIIRCKENVNHSLKESMVNIYLVDGIFNRDSKELQNKLKELILG